MGLSKKAKRIKFLERYKPSTEEYRKKMSIYSNRVRLMLYNRKLEIIENGLLD